MTCRPLSGPRPPRQASSMALACERPFDRVDDDWRLGQAAWTEFAARHRPRVGPHEQDAIALETFDVALRSGVLPHPHVHGRRDKGAFVGRQQQCGRQIVSEAAGHAGEKIGRRRRDHDEIGGARQLDMADQRLHPSG